MGIPWLQASQIGFQAMNQTEVNLAKCSLYKSNDKKIVQP